MNKIKIQFIGSFINYKEVFLNAIELSYFESVANRLQLSVTEALLDPYFYHKLKLKKYQSHKDLKGNTYFGLDVNSFHQIEVFIDGKKKQKFTYSNLNPETILFPLYLTKIKRINLTPNSMLINWKEKGVTSYITECEMFSLNSNLTFKVISSNNNLFIAEVLNNDYSLKIKKKDLIITL